MASYVIAPKAVRFVSTQLSSGITSFRLGSDEGSMLLSWSTLNPNKLIRRFRKFKDHFNFKSFEEFMKRVSAWWWKNNNYMQHFTNVVSRVGQYQNFYPIPILWQSCLTIPIPIPILGKCS